VTFGYPLLPCNPPAAPAVLPHEVRVTISTQMTAGPLRNLLATFGVDFSARRFEISSLAQRE